MSIPLPPTLTGAVTTKSPGVWVTGALVGATIQLHQNGVPLGAPSASAGLQQLVLIPAGVLVVGAELTATQTTSEGTSGESFPLIVAALPPGGLPAVVFLSALHPFVEWVQVGGVLPGCLVEIHHRGVRVGSQLATAPVESIPIRCPQLPSSGDTFEAWQSWQPAGGPAVTGPKTISLPLSDHSRATLPAPTVGPMLACDAAVLVSGIDDGASLVIHQGATRLEGYPFVGQSAWAALRRPAAEGDAFTVVQGFPQWQISGAESAPPVVAGAAAALTAPLVDGPLCVDAALVLVRGLRPGAEVIVGARRATSAVGSVGVTLGSIRAWATDCAVSLPHGWAVHPAFANGTGAVSLEVVQAHCGVVSPPGRLEVEPLAAAMVTPTIEPPMECARFLIVRDLTLGARVSVRSNQAGWQQLASDVIVTSRPQVLWLNRPLSPGEVVTVSQVGCNATLDIVSTPAAPFGGVGTPTMQPVRIPHGGVFLSGLLVGARADVFVNKVLRASMDVTTPGLFVPVSGLERGQVVEACQRMCARISARVQDVAQQGRLSVHVAQKSIARTVSTIVNVAATDAETKQAVSGSVFIAGVAVSPTNAPFVYTFGPGAAPPSEVRAFGYEPASISWPLVDPPTAPVGPRLLLHLTNQSQTTYKLEDAEWTLYRQTASDVVEEQKEKGLSTVMSLPAGLVGSQMYLAVYATTKNLATGKEEVAAYNGAGVPVAGVQTMLFVLAAGDTTLDFALRNDPVGQPPLNRGVINRL